MNVQDQISEETLTSRTQSATWEQHFTLGTKILTYNRISFNNRSERAIEVPLALEFLAQYQSSERILEVGNVLQHYEHLMQKRFTSPPRRVIDKFEIGRDVENIDLMDMDPERKFQAIIAISTVEHVGQFCTPTGEFGELDSKVDLEAPLKAIAKVYDLLEVGGRALLTVPFGKLTAGGWYVQFSAEYLELLVTSYGLPREALHVGTLKQVAREKRWRNPRQRWIETDMHALHTVRYDALLSGARAIAVLELQKLPSPFTLNLSVAPTLFVYERSPLLSRLLSHMGSLKNSIVRVFKA
ncbi:MAG: hypothetical protein ACRDHZ_20445 [Ktedonobacteraceae bacterium]